MHEFSLAEALLEQVDAHAPPHSVIRFVKVEVGPLQMVDGEAMRTAWNALTTGTRADGSNLFVDYLACERTCPVCGRSWTGGELIEPCTCGYPQPRWIDGAAFVLDSIEFEFADGALPSIFETQPERTEP